MSSKTESTLGGMRFKQYIFEDLVIQVSCHETPNVQVDISIEIFKPFFLHFFENNARSYQNISNAWLHACFIITNIKQSTY